MEKGDPHSFQLSTVLFVNVMLICFVNCPANEVSDLDRQLQAIRYTEWKDGTDSAITEAMCLALVDDHYSPADIGKIYSTIALIYSDRGYGPDVDSNTPARAYHFSTYALEYPLEPLTACHMYTRAADALVAQSRHNPTKPLVEVREEAIELCLKGLKLATENNALIEYPKPPDTVKRTGAAIRIRLERLAHMADARDQWLRDIEFCGLRQGLFRRCISLSSHKSFDQGTFEKKARHILKAYEKIAGELIAALDAERKKHKGD